VRQARRLLVAAVAVVVTVEVLRQPAVQAV